MTLLVILDAHANTARRYFNRVRTHKSVLMGGFNASDAPMIEQFRTHPEGFETDPTPPAKETA